MNTIDNTQVEGIKRTTRLETVVSIIKFVVGAGSFVLPYGFKEVGLIGGSIGLLILACLSAYTIQLCIFHKRRLFPDSDQVNYADLATHCFGNTAGYLMYFSIVASSLGACAVYFVFCASLLHTVFPGISQDFFIVIMAALVLAISIIKDMVKKSAAIVEFKFFAVTSVIGDVALIVAVLTVVCYGFSRSSIHDLSNYTLFDPLGFPIFFGVSAFLFAIPLFLFEVENNMQDPKTFNSCLLAAFPIVTVLNCIFGVLGFLFFGDHVDAIVINNISDDTFVVIVKFALVADLFFTFIIAIIPAQKIISRKIISCFSRSDYISLNDENGSEMTRLDWGIMTIDLILIVFILLIAILVPSIGDLVTLVSSVGLSYSAFVLPPLIHLQYYSSIQQNYGWLHKLLVWTFHILISVFGIFSAVFASAEALKNIIESFY